MCGKTVGGAPRTRRPAPSRTDPARPGARQAPASMRAGMRATAAPAPWQGRRARRRPGRDGERAGERAGAQPKLGVEPYP